MKVVLYIGHHKVGSTALQAFLSQNSYRLLQHGILYPYVEQQGKMFARAKQLVRGDRFGAGPINVREAHNALAFRLLAETANAPAWPPYHHAIPSSDKIFASIHAQIKKTNAHTVLLCAEAFSNLGPKDASQIERLRDAFPRAKFEIYLGLRRPDEYIVAWQSQRIRFGTKVRSLSDSQNDFGLHGIHFNFRALLEPWLEILPNANLVLRPYSSILETGGSPADFMLYSSIDFPDKLRPIGRQNPSMPTALMEIARTANFQLSQTDARSVWHALQHVSTLITLPKNSNVEMFGHSNRLRILKNFQPIHAYLNRVSNSPCFFPDYNEITVSKPILQAVAMDAALAQIDVNMFPRTITKEAAKFIFDYRQNCQAEVA